MTQNPPCEVTLPLAFGDSVRRVSASSSEIRREEARHPGNLISNVVPSEGLLDKRPFATIVDANAYLISQSLTAAQVTEIYRKAFVHVNLNTASAEEIMLIPGAGKRMVREFAEYRPWKTWGQFDKEISKYVGQPETERLKQYVFIPVNLNSQCPCVVMPNVGAILAAHGAGVTCFEQQFSRSCWWLGLARTPRFCAKCGASRRRPREPAATKRTPARRQA